MQENQTFLYQKTADARMHKKETAERIRKASAFYDDITAHIRDLEKEETHLNRLQEMHDKKKRVIKSNSDDRAFADVWDLCGKQIAILERDLVITEIDPEEIAYNAEKKSKDALDTTDKRLTAAEQDALKNLLINIKMYYFLLKQEFISLRKNSIEDLKKALVEQEKYLKKIFSFTEKDKKLSGEKAANLLKVLKRDLGQVFQPSWILNKAPARIKATEKPAMVAKKMSKLKLTMLPMASGKTLAAYDLFKAKAQTVGKLAKPYKYVKATEKMDRITEMFLDNPVDEVYFGTAKAIKGYLRGSDILSNLMVGSIRKNDIEQSADGLNIHTVKVSSLCRQPKEQVQPEATLASVVGSFRRSSNLAVVKGRQVKGYISVFDLLDNYGKLEEKMVSDVVSDLIDVQASTPLMEAVLLMAALGQEILLVKDNERQVGVVDIGDILEQQYKNLRLCQEYMDKGAKVNASYIESKQPNVNVEPIVLSVELNL